MLHPDFKNGQKVDLQSACSLFIVAMGLLFFIDPGPAFSANITVAAIVFGLAWYIGHHTHLWWKAHHPHDQ